MEYIILIISLIGIVIGANLLVTGSVSIAKRFKVSDFVIGAAIVGIGTSMPEFMVSLIGAINGNADVAIGNVVGSNIFNVLGILGITALLFPVDIERKNLKFELPLCIAVSVLLTLMVFNILGNSDGCIGRLDGLLLLIVFISYMWYSFYRDRKKVTQTNQTIMPETTPLWLAILKVAGGLTLLVTSCDFFVDNAIAIAKAFGVNEAFISLTLIACGTSLPEFAASIAAAVKKNTGLALGNIIGSNIFNISLILGICSQVTPLTSSGITLTDYIVMIIAALLPFALGCKGKIGRISGLFMLICYILYNSYLINNQIS